MADDVPIVMANDHLAMVTAVAHVLNSPFTGKSCGRAASQKCKSKDSCTDFHDLLPYQWAGSHLQSAG